MYTTFPPPQQVPLTRTVSLSDIPSSSSVRVTSKSHIPLGSPRHVTSRHDTTRSTCRARRGERVESCRSTSSTQSKCMGSTRLYVQTQGTTEDKRT